jgi:hypothetical protein
MLMITFVKAKLTLTVVLTMFLRTVGAGTRFILTSLCRSAAVEKSNHELNRQQQRQKSVTSDFCHTRFSLIRNCNREDHVRRVYAVRVRRVAGNLAK